MQVSRNDITTDEKDVVAARKDSRTPGKGFTGSGKITAVRETFYGTGDMLQPPGNMLQPPENGSRQLGKRIYSHRNKRVMAAREKFYGMENMLQPLGNMLQPPEKGSRQPGNFFYGHRNKKITAAREKVYSTGRWFTAAGKRCCNQWKSCCSSREMVHSCREKGFRAAGRWFTAAGKTILQPLGNDSQLLGKRYCSHWEMMLQLPGNNITAAGK